MIFIAAVLADLIATGSWRSVGKLAVPGEGIFLEWVKWVTSVTESISLITFEPGHVLQFVASLLSL
ncbi:hypothetical protein [Plantactinospora sp. KBS50]|uniref:hypothetical protein n=1 Tax=Plantactinospora sp. KBS50 TaxID=2024580 RepID=UPI0012FD5DB3|nr:hypothetical protein [Plantactinospora sp. KBS50]